MLSPTAPYAQITPSPTGAEKHVKQMFSGRYARNKEEDMEKVDLPNVPIVEWSSIRGNTPMGLFAYRQMQAIDLLEIPDYGGGDLTAEQRKESLLDPVKYFV